MSYVQKTEEPIVVTEPKDLAVPEFNEKEVLGIVNNGIAHGQVNLPLSGLRLYKHTISYTKTGGPGGNYIIITSSPDAILLANLTPIYQTPINAFITSLDFESSQLILISKNAAGSHLRIEKASWTDNVLTRTVDETQSVLSFTSWKDTVTEL